MSESAITGKDRDEKEAVFNRIWKKADACYERYRLQRHRQKARRKNLNPAFDKPDRMDRKNEFTK